MAENTIFAIKMTQNDARVVVQDFLEAPRSTEYHGNPKNQKSLNSKDLGAKKC